MTDIWMIILQNDECQYREPPLYAGGSYGCKHPEGSSACVQATCPVQQANPADTKGRGGR